MEEFGYEGMDELESLKSAVLEIKKTFPFGKKNKDNFDTTRVNLMFNLLKIEFENDKIYVDKSKIHGNGVFAKRDIKKGEFITIYPNHYIFSTVKNKKNLVNIINSNLVDEKKLNITDDIICSYSFILDKYYTICADPRIIDKNMLYVGHILNDALKCKSDINNINQKEKNIYEKICEIKNNCKYLNLENLLIVIVANQDIKQGEELLVYYGFDYWVKKNSNFSFEQINQ